MIALLFCRRFRAGVNHPTTSLSLLIHFMACSLQGEQKEKKKHRYF